MGNRKQKLALPTKTLGSQSAPDISQNFRVDPLVRELGHFGFEQIFPSPVEEREVVFGDPDFLKHFSAEPLEVMGSVEKPLVLPPTNFLGAIRRYLHRRATLGPHVAKWFYISPVLKPHVEPFGLEHELGIFILGEDSALANAHLIYLLNQVLTNLGVGGLLTEINNIGCAGCQKNYLNILSEHLLSTDADLCVQCTRHVQDNPTAVWSCIHPGCQAALTGAPQIVDFLDESCRRTLVRVLEVLDELEVVYALNPNFVSFLNPEKLIFRITTEPERTILGWGGSYAHWVSRLTQGEAVPLIGFLTAFEKLWEAIPPEQQHARGRAEVFIVSLGDMAARKAMALHAVLRREEIRVAEAMLGNGGIKNQLKAAVAEQSHIALIIGQKEALDETVILRDMRGGMQEVFALERIIEEVKKRLGRQ